jgi:Integrase core domain
VHFVDRYQGVSHTWIGHIYGCTCESNGIEHRPTKPYHPWTNRQAGQMVRTIKEATTKSFHYTSIQGLRRHVADWLIAYNFAKQLKVLNFRTQYEAINALWNSKIDAFIIRTTHHMLRPNA